MVMTADATRVLGEAAATAADLPEAGQLDPDQLEPLLRSFYRDVPAEDLRSREPRDLLAAALSHRAAASRRDPGETLVGVHTPEVAGSRERCTVVEVVTDDMPFLVDSISAELLRQGHVPQLTIHPQPKVLRDDEGRLLAVDAAGTVTESWINVEIAPVDPARQTELVSGLRRVLGDVRAAVADWRPMESRARDLSARLLQDPPPRDPRRGRRPDPPAAGVAGGGPVRLPRLPRVHVRHR